MGFTTPSRHFWVKGNKRNTRGAGCLTNVARQKDEPREPRKFVTVILLPRKAETMISNDGIPSRHQMYRVSIGHSSVTVSGTSRDDAIRAARRQLSQEMPRMWDVIHQLNDNRFDVLIDP